MTHFEENQTTEGALSLEERVSLLGYAIPETPETIYEYVPASEVNGMLFCAGQIPKNSDGIASLQGALGAHITVEEAKIAARQCVLQALGDVRKMVGNLDVITRVAQVRVYVACEHEDNSISEVADAASSLLVEIFGESGKHPRSVIGVTQLPQSAPILVELTFALNCSLQY